MIWTALNAAADRLIGRANGTIPTCPRCKRPARVESSNVWVTVNGEGDPVALHKTCPPKLRLTPRGRLVRDIAVAVLGVLAVALASWKLADYWRAYRLLRGQP